MNKETVVKYLKRTAIIQLSISVLTLLLCWLMGWLYLYTVGVVFMWIGIIILAIFVFLSFGGVFSGAEDLTAFSLSGAGKMQDHLKRVRNTDTSRLGFLFFGLVNGFFPVLIGNWLQTIGL